MRDGFILESSMTPKDIATLCSFIEKRIVQNHEIEKALDRLETALSSPPAIDLEGLKIEVREAVYTGAESPEDTQDIVFRVIDHLAATGKLGGDDLGELPDGWKLASIIVRRDKGWCYGGALTYDALLENGDCELTGEGTTPAEAVRKAMEKMEEGE